MLHYQAYTSRLDFLEADIFSGELGLVIRVISVFTGPNAGSYCHVTLNEAPGKAHGPLGTRTWHYDHNRNESGVGARSGWLCV